MNRRRDFCQFVVSQFVTTFVLMLGFVSTTAFAQDVGSHPRTLLIHLPGVAGEMTIDRRMLGGLIIGGAADAMQIFDWTGTDRGLNALTNPDRHREQAAALARLILQAHRDHPKTRIVITAHSGGAGIAVWALEQLPADEKIDTFVMLASALSADYDLSKALSHVKGPVFSFYSEFDSIVLGLGTRTFGTIDRQKSNAAGYVGFTRPLHADANAYAKLQQFAYDPAWMQLDNAGDHIGPMSLPFAARVLAPLINGRSTLRPTTVSTTVP